MIDEKDGRIAAEIDNVNEQEDRKNGKKGNAGLRLHNERISGADICGFPQQR